MDYSLAKELKDGGFPQTGNGRWIGSPSKLVWRSGDRVYVPTLDELIEACEREGYFNFELGHFNEQWSARIVENSSTKRLKDCFVFGHGPNRIEAVARLWLALYAKPGGNPTI